MVLTRLRSGAGVRKNYRGMAGPTPRVRKAKKTAKLSAPTIRAVKRIVRGTQETKLVTYKAMDGVYHNSAIAADDFYRCIPAVSQGVQDWQRIGDKINPTSLVVNGYVCADRRDALDTRPFQVRIVFWSSKSAKTIGTLTHDWQTQAAWAYLLRQNDESGAGSGIKAYTGDHDDNFLPINRDKFIVHAEKRINIYPQDLLSAPVTTFATEGAQGTFKRFSVRIKCPKTLTYEQASGGNLPMNFCPMMSVGYCYMDAGAPDVINTRVLVTATAHLKYKDS